MQIADKVKNILSKIESSEKVLIIISKPVDDDTLGTGLSIRWWLTYLGKKVDIVSFASIPDVIQKTFHGIEQVKVSSINKFDFNNYDLIVLEDGNSWRQFFIEGANLDSLEINKDKVIHIDHHPEAEISEELNENSLNYIDSSTSKILYFNFFRDIKNELPKDVLNWLYLALIYDTQRFYLEMHPKTFQFAEELIELGADHEEIVEIKIPKSQIDFMQYALPKMKYYKDLELNMLILDRDDQENLEEFLGHDWKFNKPTSYFIETIFRKIEGYSYGVIFKENLQKGGIIAQWRTRNSGNKESIQKILESIGFSAGGHFGAGGGNHPTQSIKNIEEIFVTALEKHINS